jgi:uncharacterized protein (TIGR03437 family)
LWGFAAAALYGSVSLLAFFLKDFLASNKDPQWSLLGFRLINPATRELWEAIALAAGLVFALIFPRFGRRIFGKFAKLFSRFAAHRNQAILAAGAFPIIVRLALLPTIPVPHAWVTDEFSHLLIANTFASGRLTNPTHPLWPHFETIYVIHQPSYTAMYPVAQGLLLAVPIVLGLHPWIAVLISAGSMCAALCWMLQGWLPPKWALLGALLAAGRFSIVTYWMNSYWGGAAGAIGGALLLGALARMLRVPKVRDAILAGVGLALLSQSRPFEGLLLSLPVCGLLVYHLIARLPESRRTLVAFAGVCAALAAATGYYDWRVTGNPLVMPYLLHQRIYGTPPHMRWSSYTQAPRARQYSDLSDNYDWQEGLFRDQSTVEGLASALATKSKAFWTFFLQPISSLPLLFLPLTLRRSRMRFLFFTAVFALCTGWILYPFYFAHYTGPLMGVLLVLVLQGARYLRLFTLRRRPVGAALFRWCVVTGAASCALLLMGGIARPEFISVPSPRQRIEKELVTRGGKHLVLVRYQRGPAHSVHTEWIYNGPDIDQSQIIWAREIDGPSMAELLHRYQDREAWVVYADDVDSALIPYAERDRPQVSAIVNAAGRSPYFSKGIAPGSIVTVFGRNLGRPKEGRAGACTISAPHAVERPETTLPGFDGSRPGAIVRGLMEGVPVFAVRDVRADSGALLAVPPPNTPDEQSEPFDVHNVSVRFGNLAAPVLCVANSGGMESLTVQAPDKLTGNSVDVSIRYGTDQSTVKGVAVVPALPGIFQLSQSGKTAAVVFHPDGSLVSPSNRARRGEVVRMFVTGIGSLSEGAPRFPIIVGVDHLGAPLQAINCGECQAGVAELRFEIPQQASSGADVSLLVSVVANGKGMYSNESVIAIR